MTNNTRKLNAGNSPSVRFVSWNIKGIGNPVKRSQIITHLKYLNTHIAFLQETHLAKLTYPWAADII